MRILESTDDSSLASEKEVEEALRHAEALGRA